MKGSSLASSTRACLAGTVCLLILGGMLVGHAWPLWTGQAIVLPVRPVDPRDLFRGEFVRLDTPLMMLTVFSREASQAPNADAVPILGAWPSGDVTGRIVYVQLQPGGDATGAYRPISISAEPVQDALNLRGRVRWAPREPAAALRIDYGLDAFFMQEGTARGVEDAIRAGRRVQMEVAVASSGRARIRNLIVDGVPLPR